MGKVPTSSRLITFGPEHPFRHMPDSSPLDLVLKEEDYTNVGWDKYTYPIPLLFTEQYNAHLHCLEDNKSETRRILAIADDEARQQAIRDFRKKNSDRLFSAKRFCEQMGGDNPEAKLGKALAAASFALGKKSCQPLWLHFADFSEADLSGAGLTFIDLRGANLEGTNFTDTRLDHAILRFADLTDANLQGATLRGTDLRFAANLTTEQLRSATNTDDCELSVSPH